MRESKELLDDKGGEILDPNPMEVPVGFARPETLQESIARITRTSTIVAQARADYETAEEADDFDIPEDDTYDPDTPFEQVFDTVLDREVSAAEIVANPGLYQRLYEEAVEKGMDPEAPPESIGDESAAEASAPEETA